MDGQGSHICHIFQSLSRREARSLDDSTTVTWDARLNNSLASDTGGETRSTRPPLSHSKDLTADISNSSRISAYWMLQINGLLLPVVPFEPLYFSSSRTIFMSFLYLWYTFGGPIARLSWLEAIKLHENCPYFRPSCAGSTARPLNRFLNKRITGAVNLTPFERMRTLLTSSALLLMTSFNKRFTTRVSRVTSRIYLWRLSLKLQRLKSVGWGWFKGFHCTG